MLLLDWLALLLLLLALVEQVGLVFVAELLLLLLVPQVAVF